MDQPTCNFETADGPPCQNPIGAGTTQCAAGHPVVTTVAPGKSGTSLTKDQVAAQVTESFDAEDILGLTPAVSDDEAEAVAAAKKLTAQAVAEWEKAKHDLERPARRKARAEGARDRLAAWANVKPESISYVPSPVDGERKSLTKEGVTRAFHLERFDVAAKTPVTIAYGNLSGRREWYVEGPCADEGCSEHSYVRIHGLQSPVPGGWKNPEARTRVFSQSLASALEKVPTAVCPDHRAPLENTGQGPEGDYEDDD